MDEKKQQRSDALPTGLQRMKEYAEIIEANLALGPCTTEELEMDGLSRRALLGILRALEAEGLIYEDTAVREGWWVPVPGGALDQRSPAPGRPSAERMARCGIVDRRGIVGTTGMTLAHRVLMELAKWSSSTRALAEELGEDPATIERLLSELQADGLVQLAWPGTRSDQWSLPLIIQVEKAAGGIHVWFGPPRPLVPEGIRKAERERRRAAMRGE